MDHEYNCPGRTTDVGLPPEPEPNVARSPLIRHPFKPPANRCAQMLAHEMCGELPEAHEPPPDHKL